MPLKSGILGKLSSLEVHHIFPKAQLYKRDFSRSDVNAIANFCLLTKDTNLFISDRLPEVYFSEVEEKHPGALASQWIPLDPSLWKVDRYEDFLAARRQLLADEANRRLASLLHGDEHWLSKNDHHAPDMAEPIFGGISSTEEEAELLAANAMVRKLGFREGQMSFDFTDQRTGEQLAVFDLVWPKGLQEGLSEPVALLLNETKTTLQLANAAGLRCFTSGASFEKYVYEELLGQPLNPPNIQESRVLDG